VRLVWSGLFLLVPIFGVGLFVMSAMTRGGWLPDNLTESGGEIDFLFDVILYLTGVVFFVTEVLLVWAMWRSRGDAKGKAQFTHGNHKLEVGWTLGTSAILIFIAFYQVPVWAKAKYYGNRPAGKTPDVMIEGSQFHWQVRYPGWDESANKPRVLSSMTPELPRSFDLANELHVYAGEMFLIHVKSRDVLHSFWVPALRVKQDTIPGNIIPVWFKIEPKRLAEIAKRSPSDSTYRTIATPAKPLAVGDQKFTELYAFEWMCAELCGWGHFRMRAKMIVHPDRADYERWLKAASAEALSGKAVVRSLD
jgi:cytochrome c oxidase subunit 2